MAVDTGASKMTTKTKGNLATFTGKATAAMAKPPENEDRVRRGAGDTVAITVRLSKANWKTLRNFAIDKGETLQTLAINGFNRELGASGLPPLDV
jgi:hypothetical protein